MTNRNISCRWVLAVTTLSCVATSAAGPPSGRRPSPEERQRERTRQVLAALQQVVPEATFAGEPLEEVMTWFREQGLTNFVVSWTTIEEAGGISRDTPVNLAVKGLALGELLDLVLDDVAALALAPEEALTFHVFAGVLRVSTRADFDRRLYTRAYYVEDLLYGVTRNEQMPFLQIGEQFNYVASAEAVVASGAAAIAPNVATLNTGTAFGPGDPNDGRPDFEEIRTMNLERLIDLLRSVRPNTWDENGGRGTVTPFSDKVVITQTIEMHEIIGGTFLQTVRYRQGR